MNPVNDINCSTLKHIHKDRNGNLDEQPPGSLMDRQHNCLLPVLHRTGSV